MSIPTFYYFRRSTPSRGALMAIRNLGLKVDIKVLDLFAKDNFSPEFLKINPQHCVPTLVDDGFILWESRAIASYLVDAKSPGNSLYPTDMKERAKVNQRLYFDATTFYPRVKDIIWPVLRAGNTKISMEKQERLHEALQFVDGFLEGQKFIAGDNLTIADIFILNSTIIAFHTGADITKYKNLAAWYERCKMLPGFEENAIVAREFGDKVKQITGIDKY